MASGFDKLSNGTATRVKLEHGVKEALIASEDANGDGNLESDRLKNLGSCSKTGGQSNGNGTGAGSAVKYDFFDFKPLAQTGGRKGKDGDDDGSEDEVDDGEEDDEEDEDLRSLPIHKKSNGNENIHKALKGKGGPEEQIQQVRQQIKSTKAEIAELERMMSHIADLRHVLTSQDATGSSNALNALARLSMKDFEEFKECLKDFPDGNESSTSPGLTKTPTNSPTIASSPNVTE